MPVWKQILACLLLAVIAVAERGMPKTEAAYLFGVSLSSIKRYTRMAREGGSLVPKK